MSDYKRESKAFPDWKSITRLSIDNKKAFIRRQSLTKEQRSKLDAIRHASRNKEIRRKWQRDYVARRKKEDPEYRLRMTMRSRFAKFKRGYNLKSISHLLGCSHQELRSHLESKMDRKMSWDNYGSYWHIDHILPCASFDHNDPKQVEQCWHWTNLQPMRAKDNLKKGFSITNPQMNLTI